MDDSYLLMATFMSEIGKMDRRTEKVTIIMRLVQTIREIGLKISNMDKAGKSGPTLAHMKEVSRTASKRALVNSNGLMVRNTRENGATTKCMERVFLSGLTAESTKATILLIRNMGSESIVGQTEENTKVIFQMANSTEKVFILRQIKISSSASGIWAKRLK